MRRLRREGRYDGRLLTEIGSSTPGRARSCKRCAASDKWSAAIAERRPDALHRRARAGHRHRATPHRTL